VNRCHAESVPCVASLDAFQRAVAGFAIEDPGLVIEPAALAAARRSLDSSGLLLLGEMHGVRENPLLIRALMQAFGLTSLALEWPDDLAPVIQAFLAGETLADHPWLWGGDGRQRAFLELQVMPVRPPRQPARAGTATPGHRRARPGPARGHRGGRTPETLAIATSRSSASSPSVELTNTRSR
jgi:hypothetical protein